MATNNTAFSPNSDLTAQITGSGQPVAGTVAATYVSGGNTTVTSILAYSRYVSITTATGNTTVITSNAVVPAGGRVVIQINNDAGGARTTTFGTGFRPSGTAIGNTSKAMLFEFVSDGTTLNELSRTAGVV